MNEVILFGVSRIFVIPTSNIFWNDKKLTRAKQNGYSVISIIGENAEDLRCFRSFRKAQKFARKRAAHFGAEYWTNKV